MAEIYRYPNFKDPAQARAHVEQWLKACPDSLRGYAWLERMPSDDFIRQSVAHMRETLEARPMRDRIAYYRTLWTLEFQVRTPAEYPVIRERIASDLKLLSQVPARGNAYLALILRNGCRLAEDKEGLARLNEVVPPVSPPNSDEVMAAFQKFQKDHPYPVAKAGQSPSQDAYNARNKALLDATAEWVQKWPDDHLAWSQRLQAFQIYREVSDTEVERATKELLRTAVGSNKASERLTLINVWATWCAPCREELPHLQQLYDK